MVWRKSSAMAAFLKKLAAILRDLPHALLDTHTAVAAQASAPIKRKTAR
jgi:LysR family hydrogen peroxide-inducible transcriptional activator